MTRIICFVGSDGSGKTTLAKFLVGELNARNYRSVLVWSRFNNYFSKPLLAFARLFGHSHSLYKDGFKLGFHDFESVWWLRWPFALLQMVDVNLATWMKLLKIRKRYDVIVYERSAWDTLSDVIVDTGCQKLATHWIGRNMVRQLWHHSTVLRVDREKQLILEARTELANDYKLDTKLLLYKQLEKLFGWQVVDNNQSLSLVKKNLLAWLDCNGFVKR